MFQHRLACCTTPQLTRMQDWWEYRKWRRLVEEEDHSTVSFVQCLCWHSPHPSLSPGTLTPHSPGTLTPHSPGTLTPHSPGTLTPHSPGTLTPHSPGTLTPPLLHRWRTLSMRACTRKWSTHSLMMLTMNWRTRGYRSTFRPTLALRMTNHVQFLTFFNNYITMIIIIYLASPITHKCPSHAGILGQNNESEHGAILVPHYSIHLVAASDGCCSMECCIQACMARQEPMRGACTRLEHI